MTGIRAFAQGGFAGVVFAVLLTAAVPGAKANFGGPADAGRACDDTIHSQCVAENFFHTISYLSSLDSRYVTAANYAAQLWHDGIPGQLTDMAVYYNVAYGTTNDLRISDGDFSDNGFYAWVRCASTLNSSGNLGLSRDGEPMNWCKPQLFYFNNWYTDRDYHTSDELKAIACHEIGHSMGLRHRSQTSGTGSCMRTNPTRDTNQSPQGPLLVPEVHDIDYHLNYEY